MTFSGVFLNFHVDYSKQFYHLNCCFSVDDTNPKASWSPDQLLHLMTIYLFTLIFFLLSIFLFIPLTCYPFSVPQLILLIYLAKICQKCLPVNEKHFLILQNEYDYFFCMSFVFFFFNGTCLTLPVFFYSPYYLLDYLILSVKL